MKEEESGRREGNGGEPEEREEKTLNDLVLIYADGGDGEGASTHTPQGTHARSFFLRGREREFTSPERGGEKY